MKTPPILYILPDPPSDLAFDDVVLRIAQVVPSDPVRGWVPYYHFRIVTAGDLDVGHINFRVGDAEHIRLYEGHVGFGVSEPFRGHAFARKACLAIVPLVRWFYETVILTCDCDNLASMRTIEGLGAEFVDEVIVPPHDRHYKPGVATKRRYHWSP